MTGSVLAAYDTNTRLGGVLPTQYSHLKVIIHGRNDAAVTSAALAFVFNNDTSANYDYQNNLTRSAPNNVAAAAATSINFQSMVGNSDTAGSAMYGEFLIPDYQGTVFRKGILGGIWGKDGTDATGATVFQTATGGGEWRSTAAITRLKIFPSVGNFMVGTRITLYGLN